MSKLNKLEEFKAVKNAQHIYKLFLSETSFTPLRLKDHGDSFYLIYRNTNGTIGALYSTHKSLLKTLYDVFEIFGDDMPEFKLVLKDGGQDVKYYDLELAD